MDGRKDTAVEALLEHLIEHGPSDIATVFGRAFELAMQIERERFLRAGPLIRSKSGFWLAIPTSAADKSLGGQRITPAAWDWNTGLRLRFGAVDAAVALHRLDAVEYVGVCDVGRDHIAERRAVSGDAAFEVPDCFAFLGLPQLRKSVPAHQSLAAVHAVP